MDATGSSQFLMELPYGEINLEVSRIWTGYWNGRSQSRKLTNTAMRSFDVLCLDLDEATASFPPGLHRLQDLSKLVAVISRARDKSLS